MFVTENDGNPTDEGGSMSELDLPHDGPVKGDPMPPSVDLPTHKVLDFWMDIVDRQPLKETTSPSHTSDHTPTRRIELAELQRTSIDRGMSRISDMTQPQGLAADDHLLSFLPAPAAIPSPASLPHPSSGNNVAVSSSYGVVESSNKSTTEHGALALEGLPIHWATRAGGLRHVGRGDSRYFGVTSNLDLDRNALNYGPFQSKGRRFRDTCEQILGANELHWVRDEEFEAHLTAQFFLWENPLLNILSESIYFQEKARYEGGEDSNLYSPILDNAM
jgi:hypothetical protein